MWGAIRGNGVGAISCNGNVDSNICVKSLSFQYVEVDYTLFKRKV